MKEFGWKICTQHPIFCHVRWMDRWTLEGWPDEQDWRHWSNCYWYWKKKSLNRASANHFSGFSETNVILTRTVEWLHLFWSFWRKKCRKLPEHYIQHWDCLFSQQHKTGRFSDCLLLHMWLVLCSGGMTMHTNSNIWTYTVLIHKNVLF